MTFDSLGGGHPIVDSNLQKWLIYEANDKLSNDYTLVPGKYREARVGTCFTYYFDSVSYDFRYLSSRISVIAVFILSTMSGRFSKITEKLSNSSK